MTRHRRERRSPEETEKLKSFPNNLLIASTDFRCDQCAVLSRGEIVIGDRRETNRERDTRNGRFRQQKRTDFP
jgi:hypothetical protein